MIIDFQMCNKGTVLTYCVQYSVNSVVLRMFGVDSSLGFSEEDQNFEVCNKNDFQKVSWVILNDESRKVPRLGDCKRRSQI